MVTATPNRAASLGELGTDGTATEHEQRAGELLGLHEVTVGPVRHVGEPRDGWDGRFGPGRQHDGPPGGEGSVTDHHRAGGDEPAFASNEAAALALEALDRDSCRPSRRWLRRGCGGRPAPNPV